MQSHAYEQAASLPQAAASAHAEPRWLRWSGGKLALVSLGFALFLFLVEMALDLLLLKEHESARLLIGISNLLAGFIAGAGFMLYAWCRRRDVTRRLNTI